MRNQVLAVAVGVLGAVTMAQAEPGALTVVDNAWRISLGGLQQDYQEQNTGLDPLLTATVVDQEQGTIPQIAFQLRQTRGPWYEDLRLRYASGSDRYSGYACDPSGACTPDTTTTQNDILTGAARLGLILGNRAVRTIPFVTVGAWSWDRNVQGNALGGGVSEHYTFGYYGAGALLQVALPGRIVWGIDGVLGETAQPTMTSQGTQFDLGTAPFWATGSSLDMPLGGGLRLEAAIRYTVFGFGASPVYVAGNYLVQEPSSTTHQFSYSLGLGSYF